MAGMRASHTFGFTSYLLGNSFPPARRTKRKRFRLIPVDSVGSGLTTVGFFDAIVERVTSRSIAGHFVTPAIALPSSCTRWPNRKPSRGRKASNMGAAMDRPFPSPRNATTHVGVRGQKCDVNPSGSLYTSASKDSAEFARTAWKRWTTLKLFAHSSFNEHDFAADNVERGSQALPEDEKAAIGLLHAIDRLVDYWINIHLPAVAQVDVSSDRRTSAEAALAYVCQLRPFPANGEGSGTPGT